ncbi:MAG: hypothetical protein NXH86_04095 [Flavobacteriaceae bacterium]|nr:hypothetical protein [Flavobacteriaceae bacterium]
MKAVKRFYGKSGRWYDVGDELLNDDQKHAPKSFVTTDKVTAKKVEKVAAKISTKNGRPKDLEDKSKKKAD